MGNSNNLYIDPGFKTSYDELQEKFRAQTPLFDVEDIEFPLSTKGMAIVDNKGRRVKLAGGNWSGGHATRHCVSGLDRQPLQQLCQDIREKFGMNCVRLTFSLQLFRKNNRVQTALISQNKALFGMTAKEIFIKTVDALTDQGLMVLLNNHTSKSQWCCSYSDGDGLWFNKQYNEQAFFKCLQDLADTFKQNKRVIGMDLRNEVRKSPSGTPTWGDGSKFDWKKAAQTAGSRIHRIAPDWLIVVGGLDYQLDLTPILKDPVVLDRPNKLVYSGHLYNFSWGPSFLCNLLGEQGFRQKWFNKQLFVRCIGEQTTPFLLGQFGNNQRDDYWLFLIRYLKELDLDWIYWCLDGYKCQKQQDQTYGIWNYQYNGQRHPEMLQDLKQIGRRKKANFPSRRV